MDTKESTSDVTADGRDSPRGEGEGSADEPPSASCGEPVVATTDDDTVKCQVDLDSASLSVVQ